MAYLKLVKARRCDRYPAHGAADASDRILPLGRYFRGTHEPPTTPAADARDVSSWLRQSVDLTAPFAVAKARGKRRLTMLRLRRKTWAVLRKTSLAEKVG